MNKNDILQILKKHKKPIEAFGVEHIGLFGSYLTDEAKPSSDIDIYVVFEQGQATYDHLNQLWDYLEALFPGKKVEVITQGGASPYIEQQILQSTEYV